MGPAAKIMSEMGQEVSGVGVARQYQGLCDLFLIDDQDSPLGFGNPATGCQSLWFHRLS